MSKYIELTSDNFDEITADGTVLVDFWATWCGPCRMIAPVIDKLAESYENKAKICKVDIDSNQELATKFGVRSIPTIIFMKDGKILEDKTMVGGQSEDAFVKQLDSILA